MYKIIICTLTDLRPDCKYLTSCEIKHESCRNDSVERVGGSSASLHTSSTSNVPPKYCSTRDLLQIKTFKFNSIPVFYLYKLFELYKV